MDIMFFIIGAFFGSFITLAVYRLPLGENIVNKHSYCPKCKHKLATLDLVPIFSYIFLGGKCRYCKEKIRIRYFLLEILSGIVFLAYEKSLNINWTQISIEKIVLLILGLLYFTGLFIIAGIDKEKKQIQKSVLIYELVIDMLYIIYVCTFKNVSVYGYVIYLVLMALVILADIIMIRKKLETNYTLQILALLILITIFSGEAISYFTILFTLIWVAFASIIDNIKRKKTKAVQKPEQFNLPIGYYLSTINIALIILLGIFIK